MAQGPENPQSWQDSERPREICAHPLEEGMSSTRGEGMWLLLSWTLLGQGRARVRALEERGVGCPPIGLGG